MTDPTPPRRSPSCRPGNSRAVRGQLGLTLVELMVGVAILAISLTLAAPHFEQWGRATRVSAQAGDLQSALTYARSESLRRGVRVTLCRSTNPTQASPSCDAGASWANGWIVFVDNTHLAGNAPGAVDGADTVLRIGEPARNSVITTSGNLGAWVAYSPQGLVRTAAGPAAGTFGVCQSPHGRRISVNPVGLISSLAETC